MRKSTYRNINPIFIKLNQFNNEKINMLFCPIDHDWHWISIEGTG